MKKRKKKEKKTSKKIFDRSEFAEVIYVDWGNPLGTKPIKSKSKLKSEEIKNIENKKL
jgi:hypothetical protein